MPTAFLRARRLSIGGTFAAPTAGPDKTALAGRVGIAVVLAITVETGPGQDADCRAILAQAAKPGAGSRPAALGSR